MKKKLLALLFVLAFLVSAFAPAQAETALQAGMEGTAFRNGSLTVLYGTSSAQTPSVKDLSVSLGDDALPVSNVEPYAKSGQGTTYLFLVDVSGSISASSIAQIKAILTSVNSTLAPGDNAAVATVGNQIRTNPFESDGKKRLGQIQAIRGVPENTNLFSSMIESLGLLSSSTESHMRKCLIVLSDGEDYYTTGVTQEEVFKKIDDTRISVDTVALLQDPKDDKAVEAAKVLGSFARRSPGGADITFGAAGTATAAQVAEAVRQAAGRSFLVTCGLPNAPVTADRAALKLTLTRNQEKISCETELDTGEIRAWQTKSSSSAPSSSRAPSSAAPVPKKAALPLWIPFAAGIFAAAVIAALILLLRRRSARNAAKREAERKKAIPTPLPPSTQAIPIPESPKPKPPAAPEPPPALAHLILTRVGVTETDTYELDMPESLTIGQSPQESQLSFPEDAFLAPAHCRLDFSEGKLTLTDLGSAGGTFVNGVPVSGERELSQDDILLLGSMELRVNWKPLS